MDARRLLIPAAILAGLGFAGGWFLWQKASSKARLEQLIGEEARTWMQEVLHEEDVTGIRVEKLSIKRGKNQLTYKGIIVVPRRDFSLTVDYESAPIFAFHPDGEARYPIEGEAWIAQEHVAVARFLGPVHPTLLFSNTKIPGIAFQTYECQLIQGGGANDLFDSFLKTALTSKCPTSRAQSGMFVNAAGVLQTEKRFDEAVEFWEYWRARSDDDQRRVGSLKKALEKSGAPDSLSLRLDKVAREFSVEREGKDSPPLR